MLLNTLLLIVPIISGIAAYLYARRKWEWNDFNDNPFYELCSFTFIWTVIGFVVTDAAIELIMR